MAAHDDWLTIDGNRVPGWVYRPFTDENDPAGSRLSPTGSNVVTDEDEIRGIRAGALNPYLKAPDVFNCPADKVKSLYDKVDPEKFVTYAIPVCLAGSTSYRYTKFSEITSPATRYNFVETAEERNFTMAAHWVFGAPEYTGLDYFVWWGPMAVNHGDSSTLGFCDGHAELQKWQDPWTKERVVKLSQQGTGTYGRDTSSGHTSENSVDLAFMAKGWPYRHK